MTLTKTQEFCALALIDRLESAKTEIPDMGVERIKTQSAGLLYDAQGVGVEAVTRAVGNVAHLNPCSGMGRVQNDAQAAYSEAQELLRTEVTP